MYEIHYQKVSIHLLLFFVIQEGVCAFLFREFDCTNKKAGELCSYVGFGNNRESMTLQPRLFDPNAMKMKTERRKRIYPSNIPFLARTTEKVRRSTTVQVLTSSLETQRSNRKPILPTGTRFPLRFTPITSKQTIPSRPAFTRNITETTLITEMDFEPTRELSEVTDFVQTTTLSVLPTNDLTTKEILKSSSLSSFANTVPLQTTETTNGVTKKILTTRRKQQRTTYLPKMSVKDDRWHIQQRTTFLPKVTIKDDRWPDDWTESDSRPSAVGIGSIGIVIIVTVIIGIIILDSSTLYRDMKMLKATLFECFCNNFACRYRKSNCVVGVSSKQKMPSFPGQATSLLLCPLHIALIRVLSTVVTATWSSFCIAH